MVSFVGPSGVGKTTLIEQLIPKLVAAGARIGTVKHAPHGHDVDKPGSDSSRHRAAGAQAVLLAGADGAVLFLAPEHGAHADHQRHHQRHHQTGESAHMHRLAALIDTHLHDVDIVLAEGYAPVHDVLIAVHRTDVPAKAGVDQPAPWFTVTDAPAASNDCTFDQLKAIADRIIDLAHARRDQTPDNRVEARSV